MENNLSKVSGVRNKFSTVELQLSRTVSQLSRSNIMTALAVVLQVAKDADLNIEEVEDHADIIDYSVIRLSLSQF